MYVYKFWMLDMNFTLIVNISYSYQQPCNFSEAQLTYL